MQYNVRGIQKTPPNSRTERLKKGTKSKQAGRK
jgi:hypothetical protein